MALTPSTTMNFVIKCQVAGNHLNACSHTIPVSLNSAQTYCSKENLSFQRRLDTIIELRPSDAAEQLLMINTGIFRWNCRQFQTVYLISIWQAYSWASSCSSCSSYTFCSMSTCDSSIVVAGLSQISLYLPKTGRSSGTTYHIPGELLYTFRHFCHSFFI